MSKDEHHISHHEILEHEPMKSALGTAFRWAIVKEASASVALDKDPDMHTCHWECREYKHCPGNRLANAETETEALAILVDEEEK